VSPKTCTTIHIPSLLCINIRNVGGPDWSLRSDTGSFLFNETQELVCEHQVTHIEHQGLLCGSNTLQLSITPMNHYLTLFNRGAQFLFMSHCYLTSNYPKQNVGIRPGYTFKSCIDVGNPEVHSTTLTAKFPYNSPSFSSDMNALSSSASGLRRKACRLADTTDFDHVACLGFLRTSYKPTSIRRGPWFVSPVDS
jgi:hypothetical protein